MFALIFFFGMGILQRKTLSEEWKEFKKKFPLVYAVLFMTLKPFYAMQFKLLLRFQFDWCIWPPTQYVNFMYVPGRFRVMYINGITVFWDIFLSYMKHYDELEDTFGSDNDKKR